MQLDARHAALAVLALLPLAACRSGKEEAVEVVPPIATIDRSLLYERATTGDELARLLRDDLETGEAARAFDGLEAFVFAAIFADRATSADAAFEKARPTLLFQRYDARRELTPVTQLGDMLSLEAGRELTDVYSSLRFGDMDAVARARSTPGAVLAADTVALRPALAPHAAFFDGAIAHADLASAEKPDPAVARDVVRLMDRAIDAFSRTKQEEPLFLALVVKAEAQDLLGADEDAAETWLRAAETSYFARADRDVRIAVVGRIDGYRDRLQAKLENDVRATWQKRVDAITDKANDDVAAAEARANDLERQLTDATLRVAALSKQIDDERLQAKLQQERSATEHRIALLEAQLDEARAALASTGGAPADEGAVATNTGSVFLLWQKSGG
ncbi:MAG: hypothetical protein R3F34_04660 [Planctomycetota bacterium]